MKKPPQYSRLSPEFIDLVYKERLRQQNKWEKQHTWGYGDCSSDGVEESTKLAVLTEEIGEVAKAYLEENRSELKKELVQVAAVCCAWLECITYNEKI